MSFLPIRHTTEFEISGLSRRKLRPNILTYCRKQTMLDLTKTKAASSYDYNIQSEHKLHNRRVVRGGRRRPHFPDRGRILFYQNLRKRRFTPFVLCLSSFVLLLSQQFLQRSKLQTYNNFQSIITILL